MNQIRCWSRKDAFVARLLGADAASGSFSLAIAGCVLFKGNHDLVMKLFDVLKRPILPIRRTVYD